MNLYNLKFGDDIRFDVEDVEDYNINGTFNPNAACDTEFFGYRETTFKVTQIESFYGGKWWPEHEVVIEQFMKYFDDRMTLIVQDAIDDKQGEL